MTAPKEASAWWNEQWEYRKSIAFDTASTGADIKENLPSFTVLIRLHSGNFDFTRAKENGEDIRFISADDTMLLKYHIESFDPFDELALIWVRVPDIPGSSNQGKIWMYYGNKEAAGGADAKNSYDANYLGVYHFNEVEGVPQDTSSYMMHPSGFTSGLGLAGAIGNGATFSGPGANMIIPDNPAYDFAGGVTVSTWLKMYATQQEGTLFYKGNEEQHMAVVISGTKLIFTVRYGDKIARTDGTTDIPLEGWHHLAVSVAADGKVTLYLDGAESQWINLGGPLKSFPGDIYIGSNSKGENAFIGDLDELRISKGARTSGWIRAIAAGQGADSSLTAFSIEEMNEGKSGLPVFYLATIFKNITLDGLVVIGMLLFLAGCSWVVMITKGIFLFTTAKGDRKFLEHYRKTSDPVGFAKNLFKNGESGLYRIYETGLASLGIKGGDETSLEMTPKRLEQLKAGLEQGLVDESRRLNAWLVVLIMSISGGPFLGLLGTVWGVMNTFAAMAEAGEANIMAIAPGVASALSTTVFGLIVAIPALFGYNYLAGKIRDITAESGVFVDQFPLKVDAIYGGES